MARKDPLTKQFERHTAAIGHYLDLADELEDVAAELDTIADKAEADALVATGRAQSARREAEVASGRAARFRELLG